MKFKKSILAVISILLFSCSVSKKEKQLVQKPNILFIAIDDMNDWTGFLGGHPQAITPNMDKLAEKGVNFTNAHCSAPGCSPSRNSLMFGVEPFKSGLYAFYDHERFPEGFLDSYTQLTELLKSNGYETYGSGKINHARKPNSKEWTEFYTNNKKTVFRYDDEAGYRLGNLSFRPTLNPLEDHVDYQNATFGVDVLARKHEKPFFLAVGLIKPHLPFNAPKQFFDLYPEDVLPPRINPSDHDDIPAVGNFWVAQREDDKNFKKDHAWTKVRRAYLACISWVDFNVGRLLQALEESPYLDNTIVVLWSDHGFALGEKQHFRKFALWEETTRTPFIIWDGREKGKKLGRKVTDAVALINIYRTVAELTGVKVPEYVDGVSLVPQLKDPSLEMTEPAICTWGRGNYAVRNRDWRYIRYYDGSEELYSHINDPDEWTNLAQNPDYQEMKKQLAKDLPKQEVPLVKDGLSDWSGISISADKPLKSK